MYTSFIQYLNVSDLFWLHAYAFKKPVNGFRQTCSKPTGPCSKCFQSSSFIGRSEPEHLAVSWSNQTMESATSNNPTSSGVFKQKSAKVISIPIDLTQVCQLVTRYHKPRHNTQSSEKRSGHGCNTRKPWHLAALWQLGFSEQTDHTRKSPKSNGFSSCSFLEWPFLDPFLNFGGKPSSAHLWYSCCPCLSEKSSRHPYVAENLLRPPTQNAHSPGKRGPGPGCVGPLASFFLDWQHTAADFVSCPAKVYSWSTTSKHGKDSSAVQSTKKSGRVASERQNVRVDVDYFVEWQCPQPNLGEEATSLRSVNPWGACNVCQKWFDMF